jgi:hypothetical protein
VSDVCAIQAQDGNFFHGPHKDSGTTWGAAVEAWLYPSEQAARTALRGLSGPSAEKARVTFAPAAALVGSTPAPVEPERRVRIKPRKAR